MVRDGHESSKSTSRVLESSAPHPAWRAAATPFAAGDAAAVHLAAHIATAVDSLPLACRAPVRMYLAGYGQGDIADLLEWTEARTRDVLRPALARVRELIPEDVR